MHRSRAVLLTPDDSRAVVLADLQIVLSAFTIFTEPELAYGRAWLNDPEIDWYVSILYSDHNCWEEAPYLLASA